MKILTGDAVVIINKQGWLLVVGLEFRKVRLAWRRATDEIELTGFSTANFCLVL